MSVDQTSKLSNLVVATLGALWLALTGLCTWGFAQDRYMGGMWPLGLWVVIWGVLPLGIGLRPFVPGRAPDWALAFIGAVWVLAGLGLSVLQVSQTRTGVDVGDILTLGLLWLLVLAPGAVIFLVGRSGLRSKT